MTSHLSNFTAIIENSNCLISDHLIPVHLQQFGLVKSIKQICNQIKNQIRFNVRVIGNPDILSKQLSIVIYRIAQELITNVAKHSECTTCTIHLKTSQEYVAFKIHDNGNGMYVPESRMNGIGLLSTIIKVELLNGRIEINAVRGEGMTINIKIPLL
ncbi:sensor histidine kinase [Sphingobacterium sp. BN32]|uniref:sensor histidine kinase n=1 Tax=Sphingobacterium sp. BN32 TaxID=3058432 RepID=UPI003464682B